MVEYNGRAYVRVRVFICVLSIACRVLPLAYWESNMQNYRTTRRIQLELARWLKPPLAKNLTERTTPCMSASVPQISARTFLLGYR